MVLGLPELISQWRGLTIAGVTLRRASAGLKSLCFFPRHRANTQHDVWRRLTPIRRRSQRLHIFFVFNRRTRVLVVRGITYCVARLFARPSAPARSFRSGATPRVPGIEKMP